MRPGHNFSDSGKCCSITSNSTCQKAPVAPVLTLSCFNECLVLACIQPAPPPIACPFRCAIHAESNYLRDPSLDMPGHAALTAVFAIRHALPHGYCRTGVPYVVLPCQSICARVASWRAWPNLRHADRRRGIESEREPDLLRALGCPAAQGFHLARPMPQDTPLRRRAACPASPP